MSASDAAHEIEEALGKVEHFSIGSRWLMEAVSLRLDASFYNPRAARALATLQHSGLQLATLNEVVSRIYIPPRFKRVYVEEAHGIPFLQGSHVVHFQPADLKYLSLTAHKGLERWQIKAGWVLVTCSGTIGRVTIAPPSWDGWAASQHILRIVAEPDGPCPAGYIAAFLSSELGQAQLTSRIYGAVVDEITEDQARSVVIPVPRTNEEKKVVAEIAGRTLDAILMKDEAARLSRSAVQDIGNLVPSYGQDPQPPVEADLTIIKPATGRKKREEKLSLHPLDPREALAAFMKVDPAKVAERERAERQAAKAPPSEDDEDVADAIKALKEPGGKPWAAIKKRHNL